MQRRRLSSGGITVAGAGLAGCEAAMQIAKRGIPVELIDIKPDAYTPAHKNADFAELVCSNSLRAKGLANAVGLLKEEMRLLGSVVMDAAEETEVAAGGALAVDRDAFARHITERIRAHPLISFTTCEITEIPDEGIVVIATGPLTTGRLFEDISRRFGGGNLHFYDAAAPVIATGSIDMEKVFLASRYDKGTPDYLNCPMEKDEYDAFYEALITAETAPIHGFEEKMVFEGCMPIETMAKRGYDTMRFGPLKPVGLLNPQTGEEAYAVVQLRRDNAAGTLYNMVGFQTRLKFSEQKRIFGMIPGLQNADFVRYGVMHRNTFMNSPELLTPFFSARDDEGLFFAGQMTGVEGYVESAAAGILAGINAARYARGEPQLALPGTTAMGALARYVSGGSAGDFQPMNINFGIMDPPDFKFKGKRDKNEKLSERALSDIRRIASEYGLMDLPGAG